MTACTCKVEVKRDPATFQSTIRVWVQKTCTVHNVAKETE